MPVFDGANGDGGGHAKVKPCSHKAKTTKKTKQKTKTGNLLRVVCTTSEERSFMNYSWSTEKAERNTY